MTEDYGATEHWKQTYRGVSVPAERVAFLLQCESCGCLVGDKDQHDHYHRKTKSVIDKVGAE